MQPIVAIVAVSLLIKPTQESYVGSRTTGNSWLFSAWLWVLGFRIWGLGSRPVTASSAAPGASQRQRGLGYQQAGSDGRPEAFDNPHSSQAFKGRHLANLQS